MATKRTTAKPKSQKRRTLKDLSVTAKQVGDKARRIMGGKGKTI